MRRVRAHIGTISRDLRKARKVRDMLHSTIAQRCVRDFFDCSKMPIIYGFLMRLIFARLQRVRPAREARAPQNQPQRGVKHTEQLVQKIFCTEARKGAPNRLIWFESSESAGKVIRRKPTTRDRARTRDDRKFSRC